MRLIAEVALSGYQPSPWSVPDICVTKSGQRFTKRPGNSNLAEGRPNLKDWQKLVKDAASEAMAEARPAKGPVKIEFKFYVKAGDGAEPGTPCFLPLKWNKKLNKGKGGYVKPAFKGTTLPDLTNLEKGTEDALEQVVIRNDFQVVSKSSDREWGNHGGCRIRIWLLEETYEGQEDVEIAGCSQSADGGDMRTKRAHGKRIRRDDTEPRRSR